MLKNPIPKVTDQLQHRAIGIINGKFYRDSKSKMDREFFIFETAVLILLNRNLGGWQ